MENQDTAKILAKSRVKLAAAAALMLILAGLAAEYVRQGRTLDEAVVVMLKPQAEPVATAGAEQAAPTVEAEVRDEEELRRNNEGAAEFIRYMQEIHERAEAVVRPESALGQIIPQPAAQAAVEPEVPVNEQVIEVYDESGEVVEIVEVRSETTAEPNEAVSAVVPGDSSATAGENNGQESEPAGVPAAENVSASEAVSAESAQSENTDAEPIVNTEENNQEVIEIEADAPAIDMMKDIIAREQTAVGENNLAN